MNKLLIDDYPIQVLPRLAKEIGLNEAIIIQQMHYWLNTSKHFIDGRKWIYNSYKQWEEQFPFWSNATIRRAISSLENQKLLITANYNRAGFDKTKWYTIDYRVLDGVSKCIAQNKQTSESNCANGVAQNEQVDGVNLSKPIPETTIDFSETSQETNYNNVKLLKSQFDEWWNLYNKKVDRKKSEDKFKKCVKRDGFEKIMDGTRKYLSTIKDKQYQKHPTTFLNGENYNDEYESIPVQPDNPYANLY